MSVIPLSNPDRPAKQLLTITQVAHLLNVEVRHVRRLVQERRIPFIKWGHLLRFDPDEDPGLGRRLHRASPSGRLNPTERTFAPSLICRTIHTRSGCELARFPESPVRREAL